MRELTLAANRANVSIFTVDPRGLAGSSTPASSSIRASGGRTSRRRRARCATLAEETGGFAVVNVNDFPAEFKRIDAETSDYYMIGYTRRTPTRRSASGRSR